MVQYIVKFHIEFFPMKRANGYVFGNVTAEVFWELDYQAIWNTKLDSMTEQSSYVINLEGEILCEMILGCIVT